MPSPSKNNTENEMSCGDEYNLEEESVEEELYGERKRKRRGSKRSNCSNKTTRCTTPTRNTTTTSRNTTPKRNKITVTPKKDESPVVNVRITPERNTTPEPQTPEEHIP